MTVKTMTYIHRLLIENEANQRRAMEIARKAYNDAESADAENLPALEGLYQKVRECWKEAVDALDQFEDREW